MGNRRPNCKPAVDFYNVAMLRMRSYAAVLSLALLPACAQAGHFTLLGFVPGSTSPMSSATNISRDATKVVGFVNNTSNQVQGCFWDIQGLHLLTDTTKALAASDSGALVVGTFNDQSFYWNGSSTFDRG